MNWNAREEFSLGYLVSELVCLNAVQGWFDLGLRTGCSYMLPCEGAKVSRRGWAFMPPLFSPAPPSVFSRPLIRGISQDCNQGEACSPLQQHPLEIDPDLAQSRTQASDPCFHLLLDMATWAAHGDVKCCTPHVKLTVCLRYLPPRLLPKLSPPTLPPPSLPKPNTFKRMPHSGTLPVISSTQEANEVERL